MSPSSPNLGTIGGAESQPWASLKGGGTQEGREGGAGSTEHGQAATRPPHRAALAPSRSSSSLSVFFHSGRLRTFLPHSQFSNGTFFFFLSQTLAVGRSTPLAVKGRR